MPYMKSGLTLSTPIISPSSTLSTKDDDDDKKKKPTTLAHALLDFNSPPKLLSTTSNFILHFKVFFNVIPRMLYIGKLHQGPLLSLNVVVDSRLNIDEMSESLLTIL